MPAGLLVTVPPDEAVTVSRVVEGAVLPCTTKLAETAIADAPTVTAQFAVPVQAPPQPASL